MAEGLLFNIIERLISKLGHLVVENWRMRDDLERLVENMSDIKAVVLDAEEQQGTNHQLQVWLDKLKDALDDADNLLDDFSTEDKKRQVMTKDKKAKKVRIFFSSSNPLLFTFKMTKRVKDIGKRLEVLNVDRRRFSLTNCNLEQRVVKQRETHSFIREEYVIGREREKNHLVGLLLNTNRDMEENVSVISIVGIGGLGKTALAQLLYNDVAVQLHFELKMWVCVSNDFDVKTIANKIIESKSNDEMDRVQQELRKKIEGKRYLLVLDDIWNEDREHWLQLMTLLMDGAQGSKIIITTRSEKVAKITSISSPFFLKSLDEEQAWKLFSQLAFENGKEPENRKLVSIGKQIVKKCSGVPLAIRSVGSLMYSMETENDWLNFKDKDLVKIDEQGGNVVFELIKLSYDHLPFHLKKCFAFCSLFPKDYPIYKKELIKLWVAQGFVQSSNKNICLEDDGDEYFMNLVHRSFFQDIRRCLIFNDIYCCKMHDLVHDMAKFVSRNDCVTVTEEGQHIDKQTHHVSFGFPLDSSSHVPSSLLKANKLRTFLLPQHEYAKQLYGELSLGESACNLIMSSLEQLRVLDLNHLNSRMLPSCIDMLTHLRYLDISFNEQIEVLPRSITKLNNLETLLLKGCSSLRELPSNLWKMISLRHLDLDGCLNLTFMPRGIGQLSNLQTLTLFVLNKKFRHSGGPSELRGLNLLRSVLEIKGLECLEDNPSEAKEINLMGKSHLRSLILTWNKQIVVDDNDMDKDNLILQGLLPHHNIKCLCIKGFGGMAISGSINPFTNLLVIRLFDCTRLQYLMPLHLLLHLKKLCLNNLPCLEWIDTTNSNDDPSTFFPSLKIIILKELHNLKGWCRCGEKGKPKVCWHQLKSLDRFFITNCPNLISLPPHTCIQRVGLIKVNEKILQHTINHSKVEILTIQGINGLKSLSKVLQHLTVVRDLRISNCEELDPCNDENGCCSMQWKQLTNLRWLEFNSIPKMESLPEGLQHVTTLERLTIRDCPNLRNTPEWITSLQL
ncbi:putative disease resistance protein RGA1, partial [Mucuna pruriens]